MLREEDLQGIFVPVITPFLPDESLDTDSYDRYIAKLLSHDIHGLIINGTTGEAPTVSWEEVQELVRRTKTVMEEIGRTKPIIVGTGTNDTRATVKRTGLARDLGVDAALIVVPYYSRPSQEGIIEHFRHAAQTGLPVISYEVPSRTGVRLSANTAATILALDGVIGMKDSSGGTALFSAMKQLGVSKPVLGGDDASFFAMLKQGAAGGILASANLRTELFLETYRQFRDGKPELAADTFQLLAPMIDLLFRESNPAPIKWALSHLGNPTSATLRLPLMPISEELSRQLINELGPSGISEGY